MAALGPGTENDALDPYDAPSARDLAEHDAQLDLDLEDVAEFEAWLDQLAGKDDPAYDAYCDARDAAYEAAMERDDAECM
jgi:hypothetical protein